MSRVKRASSGKKTTAWPIGQRVRIVTVLDNDLQFLVGRTGTVASLPERVEEGGRTWLGQRVYVDDYGPKVPVGKQRLEYWPSPPFVEPIEDYDGRQVATWDSCCWKPAEVTAHP